MSNNLTKSVMERPLREEVRIVDSLSSRQDFLTSHEHVVRVREFLTTRIQHRLQAMHSFIQATGMTNGPGISHNCQQQLEEKLPDHKQDRLQVQWIGFLSH